MLERILPLLSCPGGGRERCGGALTLSQAGPPAPVPAPGEEADWLEGLLCCSRCPLRFPILSGVAILDPDPGGYLQRYHNSVVRDIGRHGRLSDAARAWLAGFAGKREAEEYGADFRFSQQFEAPWEVAQALCDAPDALYGAFAGWLRGPAAHGPADVLAGWARELVRPGGLALDAGCGGGGLLARLGGNHASSLGVDRSFLAILLARKAVLHRPEPLRSYLLSRTRGEERERPLGLAPLENAEFLVGDCTRLPVVPSLFDLVFSSNVLDVAGLSSTLAGAVEAVRPGGHLLITDPYFFPEGQAPPGDPAAAVRAAVASHGFEILAERDGVPWAWPIYDRHWRFFFNHCLLARRS